MIGNYRGWQTSGHHPPLEEIDRNLQTHIDKLPADLAAAYDQCAPPAMLDTSHRAGPLTNGYIDATAPFKLAKDPTQSARLDTILHLSAQHSSLFDRPGADAPPQISRRSAPAQCRTCEQNPSSASFHPLTRRPPIWRGLAALPASHLTLNRKCNCKSNFLPLLNFPLCP